MKQKSFNIANTLRLGAFMLVSLLVVACSGSGSSDNLLKQIPADVDYAVVLNPTIMLESAGGSVDGAQITLPDYLPSIFDEHDIKDFNETKDEFAKMGLSADQVALAVMDPSENDPELGVVKVDDAEKFKAYLLTKEFTDEGETDGLQFLMNELRADKHDVVVVNGSTALYKEIRGTKDEAKAAMQKIVAAAAEKSLADTPFGEYIAEGNMGGAIVNFPEDVKKDVASLGLPPTMLAFYDGVFCFKGNLNGNTAEVDVKMFDKEGNKIDMSSITSFMDVNAKIDGDALNYFNDKEVLVYAVALKDVDWDAFIEMFSSQLSRSERQMLPIISSYLKKFDGTLALGVGVNNGLQSFENISKNQVAALQEISLTIAGQTKDGEAESLLSELKSMLGSMRMDFQTTDDGIKCAVPMMGVTVYAEVKGDMIVLSTHPIEKGDNPTVSKIPFDDYNYGVGIVLNNDHKLLTELGISNNGEAFVYSDAQNVSGGMKVAVDGDGSTGIIGNIFKLALAIMNGEAQR